MQFINLKEGDWQYFQDWSAGEGWRVSFQEQRLFQNQWRPYFWALHTAGQLCGFVSAVAYRESGWIGNLLVPEDLRGQGFGSALFDFALDYLKQNSPKRIWLTASEAGQPLYERRGFRVVDRIDRWMAVGSGSGGVPETVGVGKLIELDSACWGESRAPLLDALSYDGHILSAGQTLGLLQPGIADWQLGPWLSADMNVAENRQLLMQSREMTSAGKNLLVDLLASSQLELVLRSSGFRKTGSNQLMALSSESVDLNGVLALASLGSIG